MSERERQQAVDETDFEAFSQTGYDDIARAASTLFDTPVALVTVIDHDQQRFLGKVGTDFDGTPRSIAFCDVAIADPGAVMVVEDLAADARFAANPLVTAAPYVRFYAGAPLVTDDGQALGTLCVLDVKPRRVDHDKLEELRFLAKQVMTTIADRRKTAD